MLQNTTMDDANANRVPSSVDGEPQRSHSRQASLNNQQLENYANLLLTLQSEPQHLVALLYLVRPPALDRLVLTIMNSIYGSAQPGEGSESNKHEVELLLGMVRMVLSRDLAVSENQREAYWRGGVSGRILGAYARRRACQVYISATLKDYVTRIVEHELLNVEIDPVKVYQQIVDQMKDMGNLPSDFVEAVTLSEAGANPGVQAIVKQRVTMLNEIATNILKTIIEHPEVVPIEIRRLCKLIHNICKEQQPELSDDGIRDLQGEFLFIRVIVPALLRPHAHGLVDGAPSKNPSRTLALVSNMIRCTHRNSAEDQEPCMETIVNDFSIANKARVAEFLVSICAAEDVDSPGDVVKSPAENLISIRLDALFHLHALLVDFRDKMDTTDEHRLHEDLAKCGPRPSQAQLDSKDSRVVQFRYSLPSPVETLSLNNW